MKQGTYASAVAAWTALCLAGWFGAAMLTFTSQSACRSSGDFACFDPGMASLLEGIPVGVVWLLGWVVITFVRDLTRR